jgi:flavin reductase (DIM6/NTAB) family NADH-FMN oxidoreductase RutF
VTIRPSEVVSPTVVSSAAIEAGAGAPPDIPVRVAPALDIGDYRRAIGHFATGVTVVTTIGETGPSGLTANAVCSLSLEPLLMIVCLDKGSRTLEAVRSSGRLAVNVLAHDQRGLAVHFAGKAPESEQFQGITHHEVDGLPVLDGVVAWLTGSVRELVPGGDHVIGVAEVTGGGADGGDPLVFFRGAYHGLGEGLLD